MRHCAISVKRIGVPGRQTLSVTTRRDRLRELLDAVLDEDNTTLGRMAAGVYSSPFHFARLNCRAKWKGDE